MALFWPVLALAAAGLLAAAIRPRGGGIAFFALAPAAVAAWLAMQLAAIPPGQMRTESVPWFGALGAGLDMRLDGFGGLMALLITGVGALVVVYTSGYMNGHRGAGRFLFLLFLFMAAMLGLVLADNLILLFVFWELTSITSYLLVGFNHEEREARGKALQALLVTGAAGLALLAGLLLLGQAAETWRLSEILARGESIRNSSLYPAITILVMVGALAKSAQVPLHFWLPNAMAAPTPASAFLHSSTMVKAGVFLLALLAPVLGGTGLWHGTLTVVGAATLLTGAGFGLVQTDLKRILAYTTLAVLGVLTLLLGIGTELAMKSMVVFLLGHALYKAALFMVAGTVDHETGTRDIARLGGLRRAMPLTAAAGMLAAFSKAGFPPFFGFLGKEYVYKTGTAMESLAPALIAVAFAGNVLLFALALKAGWHPFWARAGTTPPPAHEGPASMWAPPLVLAAGGLAFGLAPGWVSEHLIGPAAATVLRAPVESRLALWHGFNLPFLLSGLTIAAGVWLYGRRRLLWRHRERVESLPGPAHAYDRVLQGAVDVARRKTRFLQSGALRRYVLVILASATALVVWKFARFAGWPDPRDLGAFAPVPALVCLLVAGAAIAAAAAASRLASLLALGVAGAGIALLFLYYSAPDLAITQVLVEALTVVLLLMVVRRLPDFRPEGGRWRRARDGALAGLFGLCLALLVLKATQVQIGESVAETLGAWSVPQAHGRNVVNVILVDFRALDTFGEIVVLAIAALGVAALLQRGAKARKGAG